MNALQNSMIRSIPFGALQSCLHRDVIGINYHFIGTEDLPHASEVIPRKTPDQFEADLQFLLKHFNPVSWDDVECARMNGSALPKRAMVITFDDGLAESTDTAYPLLLKHGVPATFFLITGCFDNDRLALPHFISLCVNRLRDLPDSRIQELCHTMGEYGFTAPPSRQALITWIRELDVRTESTLATFSGLIGVDPRDYAQSNHPYIDSDYAQVLMNKGFTIGAHTNSHPQLWLIDDEDRLSDEIAGSCDAIRQITGKKTAPFSFPYRSNGIARSRLTDLRARYPQIGFMGDTHGFVRDESFIVPRISCDSSIGARPGKSNLDYFLRRAYLAQIVKQALGKSRPSPSKH